MRAKGAPLPGTFRVLMVLLAWPISAQLVSISRLSNVNVSNPVEFELTFINNWKQSNHPNGFPSSSAHWSPPVFASHNNYTVIWAAGSMASTGVKIVAETGKTAELRNELDSMGDDVLSYTQGYPMWHSQGENTQILDPIFADEDHTYVTLITMIAPSPDWIAGFSSLNLAAPDIGGAMKWREYLTVSLFAHDAGTDSGENYNSGNSPTDPPEPIHLLSPMKSNVFLRDEQFIDPVAFAELKLKV